MPINLKRRKSVMARSIKLGHCVCNPRQPCPCDTFQKYNTCTCAGERLPLRTGSIPLTKHVRKAGCASKIGQADLLRMLSNLPAVADPNVLLGTAAGDDAGIYRLDDQHHLVLTVDVFTPCVDDPYLFGQIAAANSLSDVYAMGGRPLTALSIIAFPSDELDGCIMEEMLCGGVDKLAEASCSLIGGHSIDDEEIKCGFAVVGLIDPAHIIPRDKARPGDLLVLTKPLGTGIVSFASQIGRLAPQYLAEIGLSMATLNKDAAELMIRYKAHAATDVTGFGLMGHLVEMMRGSGVGIEIDLARLPVFAAVSACLENEILPGAVERNEEYAMAWVRVPDGAAERYLPVVYDPQTSGGMLVSLPADAAALFVKEMHARGHTATAVIGRIVEKAAAKPDGEIVILGNRLGNFTGDPHSVSLLTKEQADRVLEKEQVVTAVQASESLSCCTEPLPEGSRAARAAAATENVSIKPRSGDQPPDEVCCASSADHEHKEVSMEASALFSDFMKEVNKPGLIDERSKKLMAIALSICQRCAPCLRLHIKSALSMGISKAEIDEAAWLAISFTGCTGMMFYKDVCADLNL